MANAMFRAPIFLRGKIKPALLAGLGALCLAGCASHPRDFISNGAATNLPPTNPLKVDVLDSVPKGMVIGTIIVDRSKAKDQADIIAQAKIKAAAVGGDFIVWEDSVGTLPSTDSAPEGGPPPNVGRDSGTFGHGGGPDAVPSSAYFKSGDRPKAQFTVGVYLNDGGQAPSLRP